MRERWRFEEGPCKFLSWTAIDWPAPLRREESVHIGNLRRWTTVTWDWWTWKWPGSCRSGCRWVLCKPKSRLWTQLQSLENSELHCSFDIYSIFADSTLPECRIRKYLISLLLIRKNSGPTFHFRFSKVHWKLVHTSKCCSQQARQCPCRLPQAEMNWKGPCNRGGYTWSWFS